MIGAGADIALGCARSKGTVTAAITPDAELDGSCRGSTCGEHVGWESSVVGVKRPPLNPIMETYVVGYVLVVTGQLYTHKSPSSSDIRTTLRQPPPK